MSETEGHNPTQTPEAAPAMGDAQIIDISQLQQYLTPEQKQLQENPQTLPISSAPQTPVNNEPSKKRPADPADYARTNIPIPTEKDLSQPQKGVNIIGKIKNFLGR